MQHAAEVQYVDPRSLKNSLLNIQLYGGQDPDVEFRRAVEELGIKVPLTLAADGETIVSGHRRRQIAITLGYSKVPVIVDSTLKTEDDIHEALILLNRQRERTDEQKAREYKVLKEITQRRYGTQVTAPIPGSEVTEEVIQEARAKRQTIAQVAAAEAVGSSVATMERAVKVVDKIDELQEQGETEQAEQLRETLNTSVRTAAQQVTGPPQTRRKSNSSLTTIQQAKSLLRDAGKLSGEISKLFQKADQAMPGHDEQVKRCMDTLTILNRLVQLWSDDL